MSQIDAFVAPVGLPVPEDVPASYRASLCALEVGETFSLSKRLDQDQTTGDVLRLTATTLQGTAFSAAHRAKRQTGHTYVVETGEFRTKSYDLIVVCAITRTA